MYSAIAEVLTPFLIFLSFSSSFINRNQTLSNYLISSMVVVLITSLTLYFFPTIMTNLLNVSILNANYINAAYFSNFFHILIVNMLLSLASFLFVVKTRGFSS